MSNYRYIQSKQTAPRESVTFDREVVADGDYGFKVQQIGDPQPAKSGSGNHVLQVVIELDVPSKHWVWSYPTDKTPNGGNDDIGQFLTCINAQVTDGEEPDWTSLIGSTGKVRIRTETPTDGPYAGKPRNVVAFFHAPKAIGPKVAKAKIIASQVFGATEDEPNPFDE